MLHKESFEKTKREARQQKLPCYCISESLINLRIELDQESEQPKA